jgi:hypothetical protein
MTKFSFFLCRLMSARSPAVGGASASKSAPPAQKKVTAGAEKKVVTKAPGSRVRLLEIDPNAGPLDVAQRVTLLGENIDPSRVKAKFGAQAAVFLQASNTVSFCPV